MLQAYLSAAFQTWAARKTANGWPSLWRLKERGICWQLKNAQKVGTEIELRGPVIIRNSGVLEIGNRVIFDANWYKPIYLQVARPVRTADNRTERVHQLRHRDQPRAGGFIGAHSLIGIDRLIYDTDWHSLDGLDRDVPIAPTRIGRGVWLGARVIVTKGVTIGDNTVVAANSVVTSDLPAGVLAAAAPQG